MLLPGLSPTCEFPFSFSYGGRSSDELLGRWRAEEHSGRIDSQRTRSIASWEDPETGLRVELEAIHYSGFAAADWVLRLENTGNRDTPILEDIQSLSLSFNAPMSAAEPYRLHITNGAPSNPSDFEPRTAIIDADHSQVMSAGGGRSSNRDLPFFKIDLAGGALIAAVGWSGQWCAEVSSPDGQEVRIRAGIELTHFVLHPGERVRMPRILLFYWRGDSQEANAQFRQLIYAHYCALRDDGHGVSTQLLPTPFCNTCFTRGGMWLNECDAENQISLLRAYAPLGLEALLTDAGWFEGGWPAGAGNWTPRKDAYPRGMAPIAAAAREEGMIYGLWFEPERVVAGTWIHRNHPEWILSRQEGPDDTYLLNMGLPEVRTYFFDIVKGFMNMPGFRVYRQDFNMDPLPYWRFTDAPDRQGITEINYVQGLYEYWDRIAMAWPDSFREECASGGRRIDLETITRMHVHQKSDYWFDNEVDQASIWGYSQYLPNNVVSVPLCRLDDYSFHSAMASSLVLGWIADAPDFDRVRGRALLDRYRAVRDLLIGAWYPLTPYSREKTDWLAMQFHRPDRGAGMILAFRRVESPDETKTVRLRGLDEGATYRVTFDSGAPTREVPGSQLMPGLDIALGKGGSDLILYRRAGE